MKNFLKRLGALNWLNYLIELIIVFLGITIAFYINQRAEVRRTQNLELAYLKMVKKDLEEDSVIYLRIIDFFNEDVARVRKSWKFMENDQKNYTDSIAGLCQRLSQKFTYHPDVRTYHSLVQNGEILKITNLELRKELAQYYAYHETFTERFSGINRIKREVLFPQLEKNYNLLSNTVLNQKAFYDQKMSNALFTLRNSEIQIIWAYRRAGEMSAELRKLIQTEVESLSN